MFDGTVSCSYVEWIARRWGGPLAVKGVLRPDDARRAADSGATAVVVSDHGGGHLAHVPPTIDALPSIVDAVGDRLEVLLDSGVRRGADIAAALALGARAFLIGRAYLYGLAVAAEAGVQRALDILAGELRTTMALAGAASLDDLTPDMIALQADPHLRTLPDRELSR